MNGFDLQKLNRKQLQSLSYVAGYAKPGQQNKTKNQHIEWIEAKWGAVTADKLTLVGAAIERGAAASELAVATSADSVVAAVEKSNVITLLS